MPCVTDELAHEGSVNRMFSLVAEVAVKFPWL